MTSLPLAQPQVFDSRRTDTTWRDVVPSMPDFLAFCHREGLPGEDPGPLTFRSVPPTDWGCHESSTLSWIEGESTVSICSFACRLLSCPYCACWKNVERLSQTAERLDMPFSAEYVAQIYNGLGSRCKSEPHIQLNAAWFSEKAHVRVVKRRLRSQAGRLRKRGQTVEYFAVADQGGGWWVLSTVPMWDQTVGRRGRRAKAMVASVPVAAEVGLAWLFGIFSSARANGWTRSEGWEPLNVHKASGKRKIKLGTGRDNEIERVHNMLGTSLKGLSKPEARAAVTRAFKDDRSLSRGTASCTSCGGPVERRDSYSWEPMSGFTCSSCRAKEYAEKAAHLIAPTLRPLLAQGPVNEGAIERHLAVAWSGHHYSFWKHRKLLERALTLVGAVCHPDGQWYSAEKEITVAW
jgi:hypothetical protein